MKLANILLFLAVIEATKMCTGYKILGLIASPWKSHCIVMSKLLKGLADKGHQIDVINVYPSNEESYPNYTRIMNLTVEIPSVIRNINFKMAKNLHFNPNFYSELGYEICKSIGNPDFLKFVHNSSNHSPYDAIVIQLLSFQCFAMLGHLWNIPVIYVSTTSLYPWMHDMIGNPENIAFSPNSLSPLMEGNGFWARFFNAYIFYTMKLTYYYGLSRQDQLLRHYFGSNVPSIYEIERNTSLVLVNTHFTVNGVKPMATNLIEIGGIHIGNEGPDLEENIKKWLDESPDGVILLTIGSGLTFDILPKGAIDIIFKGLQKVGPKRILIKIEHPEKVAVKIPNEFYHLPWISQQKVLKHPNIKLFITHGGQLGIQESVYYGKPILCLPISIDQPTNCRNCVSEKIALSLDITAMTQEEFDAAIDQLLNNPMYSENAEKLSNIFRYRPLSALDTAAFWIEFVVRNGKDILKSPALDLAWWQVALLDIYAVTFIGLFVIIFIVKIVVRASLQLLYGQNRKIPVNKQKNN